MQLRPHQREACDAMLKHNRGQIIVPTGGGKTMCMIRDAIDTIDRLDISTIVVVAVLVFSWQNNSALSSLSTLTLKMLRFCTFTVVRLHTLEPLKLLQSKISITSAGRTIEIPL